MGVSNTDNKKEKQLTLTKLTQRATGGRIDLLGEMTSRAALFSSIGLSDAINISKSWNGRFQVQLRTLSQIGFLPMKTENMVYQLQKNCIANLKLPEIVEFE